MTEQDHVEFYKLLITELLAQQKSGVTFAKIDRYLRREEIPHDGEHWLAHPFYANVVIWKGRDEFIEAFKQLLDEDKIHLRPASVSPYVVYDAILDIKIAEHPLDGEFSEPTWAPYAVYSGDGLD